MQLRAFKTSKMSILKFLIKSISGAGKAGSDEQPAVGKCQVGERSSGKFNRDFAASARY